MDETAYQWLSFRSPWGLGFSFIWGTLWGSFCNVVIARLPTGESVVAPASHCRKCGTGVSWYDNLPIVSFLLLRGKCRQCGHRYGSRYMLVEALVGALHLGAYYVYVVVGDQSIPVGLSRFVLLSLFITTLTAVSFIDLDTMRIPNRITYPAIPLFAIGSVFMGHAHWWDGALGAVVGYLLIRGIADGYRVLTGRQGMGYGDAKLLAMIGGLLSWRVLLPVLFLASLQGSLVGIPLLVATRRASRTESTADDRSQERLRHAQLPFGPFISMAAMEVMLLENWLPDVFPYFY